MKKIRMILSLIGMSCLLILMALLRIPLKGDERNYYDD